jgi:hypothetical protein
MGHIQYFFLEDWKVVTEFCHTVGIRELYANHVGSHLVVVDDKSEGYVYNPVSVYMTSCSSETCDSFFFRATHIRNLQLHIFWDVMLSLGEWFLALQRHYSTFKMFRNRHPVTQHHVPEDLQRLKHHYETLRFRAFNVVYLMPQDAVCVDFPGLFSTW